MSYIETRSPRSHFGLRGEAGGAPAASFKAQQAEAAKRETDNTKRTAAITLAALGVGAVGLYFVARSGAIPEGTPQVFTNVEQCVQSGVHANGVCEAQWNEASRVHDRAAPAYDTMEACEQTHGGGKCVRPATPDDAARAAKYIPAMGGYFFGKTSEGTFRGVPLYSMAADGAGNFRIAELPPPEVATETLAARPSGQERIGGDPTSDKLAGTESNLNDKAGERGNSSSRTTILFIPGARASAPGAAAAPAGAMPANNPAASRPMGPAPAATAPAAARGGFGSSARVGGVSSSGG